MHKMLRGRMVALGMLGLSACASSSPDKTLLAAQPAPVVATEDEKPAANEAPAVVAEEKKIAADKAPAVVADQKKIAGNKAPAVVAEEKKLVASKGPAAVEDKTSIAVSKAPSVMQEPVAKLDPNREIRARHIMAATREAALQIIAKLESGADFATLAKQESTDPSARDNAGELGFFRRGQMTPPFEEAAYALPVGQFSRTPVHTVFGWHVILVEEQR